MADIPDNLGRMGNFKDSDFDALAENLRSAVGKAVEYAAGRSKENQDDIKKEFDRLVEAMEELGDDIKEGFKSSKKFVEEVKGAAESMDKRRAGGGSESLAEAQREQTRILQMILRSHQRATSDKSAKFTSGGTVLASAPPKRNNLKDMGFRPRGADKIPAMLSPGEFVVNQRDTSRNEPLLNKINKGYFAGGKVKPEYRTEGGFAERLSEVMGGRRHRIDFDDGKAHLIVEGKLSAEELEKVEKTFSEFGMKSSISFRKDFDRGMKESLAKWSTGLAQAFTGHDPFQVLFEGGVKDITMFRREMRVLAYQSEGITGEFRESQAEFAKIGDSIVPRTGASVTAFQTAYMNNARKGFKDQKASMKVIESGLKMSTLIGSETQATATLFADWHRDLGLGAVQMERMANNMQTVAKRTGVTGDELVGVMKSSEQILKNLRNQGTLTTTAARNIVQSMAEFKKQGFEEEGQRTLTAMSGFGAFQGADQGTKTLLSISANRGGVDYQDLMYGDVPQDQSKMGQMGDGLKDFLADTIKVDPKNFDFDMLTKDQRRRLSIVLEQQGSSIGAAQATMKTFEKIQAGLGGSLAELDKIRKSSTATNKQKEEAEKKMNDQLLSSSMDMLQSVTQVTDKYADKSLAEVSKLLGEDNKFSQDFNTGSKDMATLASNLSSATKNQFGLSGTAEQMEKQIAAMGKDKQIGLRYIASAEQLDKTMASQGKGSKDFSKRMQEALAKGDDSKAKAIAEEMGAAFSESQVGDAKAVDPMEKLEQTMQELNETIRKHMGGFVGGLFDMIGHTGMFAAQILGVAASLHHLFDKDIIGGIKDLGLGEKLMSMGTYWKEFISASAGTGSLDAMGTAFSAQLSSTLGPILTKSLGPLVLLFGAVKGIMESAEAKRTKTEGAILGALTGGAKTGSFITGRFGEDARGVDKALGVAGAAAWGASAGAAISLSLGGSEFGAAIVVGAIIGAFVEIVKIITEGTDILKDLFKPAQVLVDYVYDVSKGIYEIFAGIFTLDIGRAFVGLFDIIGSTIMVIPRLILGVIQAIVIGLPKLIFRALAMVMEIPGMVLGSISRAFISLGDNQWVGPIFKTLSAIFEPIYAGLMAIISPIAALFRGLYRVFDDLGKALFGASTGGSMLGGVMWVVQQAVWGLSYVISWIISPLIILAQALGFVLRMVGALVSGIVGFFGYMYDVLVGHSIIPDLVFGIIKFFAMLPIKIMGFLLQIPIVLGRALLKVPEMIGNMFSGIGQYFQSFKGDGILSTLIRQLGLFYSFIGSTLGNLVGMASGILKVIAGILSLDFGMIWGGLKEVGGSIVAQLKNIGGFIWGLLEEGASFLYKTIKKVPMMFLRGLKAVFFEFPSWLMGKLMDGVWAVGNFLIFTLPKIMWQAFKNSLGAVGKYVYDTISWPFKKIKELIGELFEWITQKAGDAYKFVTGIFDLGAWGGWISGLGTQVYEGLTSSLQGVWDWIKSWIPGSGAVEAVGNAWQGTKNAAGNAWEGLKAAGSYLNPLSYFEGYKVGTKKIERPGLAMLHAGEMVVPKGILDKMSAMGNGVFGSISSFVKGGNNEDSGSKTLFASLRDRIAGLGDSFKDCCGGESNDGADGAAGGLAAAISEAFENAEDASFFGKIKKKFALANSQVNKFFKPMTTGFLRARKQGGGFFGSITKGLKSQYMSMTKGGFGEKFSQGADWLSESIFGKKEGADTKKGIFQRIKEGIFGGKEGEDTKKGILDIVKEGLFGSGDDVKKGLFQIAKEGLFGKEGEGGGILGWIKGKVFGQKMEDGEMGPPKPGLVDSVKDTASSMWSSVKEKIFGGAEDSIIDKAKGVASSFYEKAKGKIFGQKMADGEMGPPKPGLLDRAKSKAGDLYGKAKDKIFGQKMADGEMGPPKPGLLDRAKSKAGDLYGKAKDKIFGKDTSDRLKDVGDADKSTKGDFTSFKDKMKNIAEGIKQFADMKVLGGALNLIPASIGLIGMIPGTVGARMIAAVDGETLKKSLKGMAEGVSEMGKAKVLVGAGALVVVALASLALLPALPGLILMGVAGPMIGAGFRALGKGLSLFGKAAANPYTWLGVLLLGALNVAMIPLAYALSLLAPTIEAFGTAIKSAFEGAGSMLKAVGESIGMILKEITMSKALALGVAAIGITALGVAMAAFAAGSFIASWISYFAGDGVFNKLMQFADMSTDLMIAATAVNMLSEAMSKFAANKGGGWSEWLTGSDGVIEGFKKLTEIGTPEFHATSDSMSKMAEGLEKMQSINSVPTAMSISGDSTTATASGPSVDGGVAQVEPVHLRDISGTILRDRAGSGGNRLQSDELSRMEEASYKQVSELEQIKQGIQELVSLMKPKGSSVGGSTDDMDRGNTRDPRRPMHAVRFGKMKYGRITGQANRSFVNNGEV